MQLEYPFLESVGCGSTIVDEEFDSTITHQITESFSRKLPKFGRATSDSKWHSEVFEISFAFDEKRDVRLRFGINGYRVESRREVKDMYISVSR
jgi:hypothetical protein